MPYMPTLTPKPPQCRHIWHTWSVWVPALLAQRPFDDVCAVDATISVSPPRHGFSQPDFLRYYGGNVVAFDMSVES